MNTMSYLVVCDKGTTDGPVTEIIMRTDDDKKESKALNCGSQGKSTRHSILPEEINHTTTTPELKNGNDTTHIKTNEQARVNNNPDGKDSAETKDLKGVIDDTHGHGGGEDEPGKVEAPELEIVFGIGDLRTGYDGSRKDIYKFNEPEIRFGIDDYRTGCYESNIDAYKFNELSKVIFEIALLPKGKGLQSICTSNQDVQPGGDDMYMPSNNSEDDNGDDSSKEISGTITLVIGNRENERSNLVSAYLNGVRRNTLVDTGAAASIIHNSNDPKKR